MKRSYIAAAVLIAAFCLQAVFAIPHLSATSDEVPHLAGGYSYWVTRDYRINPEHPPLVKLLAALPLLIINPSLDFNHPGWTTPSQWVFGFVFLYGNNADQLLFWGRLPVIALGALGALVVFLWARDLFGPAAGVFAASLYAFSPNLLAHGTLVTTDVPLAAFYVLTLYLFWKQGDNPAWKSSLLAGLALGAAMTTKYSGAFVPFLIVILAALRAWRSEDRWTRMKSEFRGLCIMAAASLMVIEAVYLFTDSPLIYFRNAGYVNANHDPQYPYYLLGHVRPNGWWYYFFAAFVFKATIPSMVVIAFAAVRSFAGFVDRWAETILLLGIAFYVGVIMLGANDIGVRYLLPIFPLLFIWGSRIVPECLKSRAGTALIAALFVWQAWAALSSFPNYMPYFNEWVGGPRNGVDYLDDSNVDWGQGVKQAAQYVKERGLKNVKILTFSPFDNPEYYGLPGNLPPGKEGMKQLLFKRPEPGVYIITAHAVARMRLMDQAWQVYKPIDLIGGSLWVYEF
jgi:4-amino-4-deoxy-L-arabinose transferase-like glycosyltransferase